jgi:hypothetical protein
VKRQELFDRHDMLDKPVADSQKVQEFVVRFQTIAL